MTAATSLLGPKSAPDEISVARLRRVLVDHFGEVPDLDAHLALLDSRGVRYALDVARSWDRAAVRFFFGAVRHVVRTQCDGPPPAPDVEGWIAAGKPDGFELGVIWGLVRATRYPTGVPGDPAEVPRTVHDPAMEALDTLLLSWPGEISGFIDAYCLFEAFVASRGIQLPPIIT